MSTTVPNCGQLDSFELAALDYLHQVPVPGDVVHMTVRPFRARNDREGVARVTAVSPDRAMVTYEGVLPDADPKGGNWMRFFAPAAFRDVEAFLTAAGGRVWTGTQETGQLGDLFTTHCSEALRDLQLAQRAAWESK